MSNIIWHNTWKYLYNIEIDGKHKRVIIDYKLDYKKSIAALKKENNAKKVFITYLGRVSA